jgi:hypothetical protein
MKLFLSSSGLENLEDHFLDLLSKDPKSCTAGFVPTAADPEEDK